jgi:hypothetical protein
MWILIKANQAQSIWKTRRPSNCRILSFKTIRHLWSTFGRGRRDLELVAGYCCNVSKLFNAAAPCFQMGRFALGGQRRRSRERSRGGLFR